MKFNIQNKGSVSFARRERPFNAARGDEYDIVISVNDELSGKQAFELTIDAAELVAGLTTLANRPCAYKMREENFELLGLKKEHKTIWIRQKGKDKVPTLSYKLAAAGWVYNGGYGNHHRAEDRDGKPGYNCSIIRFVEPEEETEVEVDLPWEEEPQKKKKKGK